MLNFLKMFSIFLKMFSIFFKMFSIFSIKNTYLFNKGYVSL